MLYFMFFIFLIPDFFWGIVKVDVIYGAAHGSTDELWLNNKKKCHCELVGIIWKWFLVARDTECEV